MNDERSSLGPPHLPPAAKATCSIDVALLERHGLFFNGEHLVAGRKSWRVGEIRGIEAVHLRPAVRLPMVVAITGAAIALPLLMSRPMLLLGGSYVSAGLGVTAALIFASIAWLVSVHDSYCVVVATARERATAFSTRDHQLVVRLVAVLSEAVATRGGRNDTVAV